MNEKEERASDMNRLGDDIHNINHFFPFEIILFQYNTHHGF